MAIGLRKSSERQPSEVALHRRDLIRVQGKKRGQAVTCLEGTVWVTQAGDPRDHVLFAGEHMSINRRGSVLVQAVRDAKVRVNN